MLKRSMAWAALMAVLVFSPILRAQTASPKVKVGDDEGKQEKQEKWDSVPLDKSAYGKNKAAPAPRRDLSGVWDATTEGGVQAHGSREYTGDKPNTLPFTPLGEAAFKASKPTVGRTAVPAGLSNDPVPRCEPQGFPRMELYELRTIEILQTADQVVYLDQFQDTWRIIWADGRELPKEPEPRWNGYSVGKWVDDYTFVAQTVGMDERTWLDAAGRRHSSDLRVEERFHRVDNDTLELTVTIDDPKMYTKPWVAMNKMPLHLQPRGFDIREFICSPSENEEYNKLIGDVAAVGEEHPYKEEELAPSKK